ncbi:MAG: methionyl-tRNA formyltransferase [Clostridiales bacterium]|jgi:methionyl-tRNA formyltransferase|nr:methionyl-tRNA formyltransferase [Clostridiales bacterium]
MRIIFMGTPDFAAPCLQALLDAGHQVCGVFTQPDKPKGRGYALTPPPVKELALRHGLEVFQPKTLRDGQAAAIIAEKQPEMIVVVAYGKILPKEILDLPPYGCVNVHASLLPRYRGAAPIQWSVINGDSMTGVTTMYMAEGLDTGDMLLQAETPIDPEETAGELHDRLAQMGAKLMVETAAALEAHAVERRAQDDSLSCYAEMLHKGLSKIDWNKPAQTVHNLVRGLSPWPVASTVYHGKGLKIHKTAINPEIRGAAGVMIEKNGQYFVCCGEGAVELLTVQYEGGKRMAGKDFFRGHPLEPNETLA